MDLPHPGRSWLVRLRWGVAAGQLGIALFAGLALGFLLSPIVAATLVGVTLGSNVLLARTRAPAAVHAAIVLDLVLLTVLLALTGGASNPFSSLYLLYVALAAILLGPRWTAVISGLAALGFALLFAFTDPHAMHRGGPGAMEAHLWGMWLALSVTGAGITWFVARLARGLRAREAEVARLRGVAESQERVVALAALAAGAAHELGSPLAAIAVSAREIELLAPSGSELAEEARAQHAQIERCRAILSRLSQRAGAPQAEASAPVVVADVWGELHRGLALRDRGRVTFVPTSADLRVQAPASALTEALGCLLQNGLQSGPGEVRVTAEPVGGCVELTVEDRGCGVPRDVMARAGEPFVTTRPAGEGMGLGLFLARRFAEGAGGELLLGDRVDGGTRAALRLRVA